jgi:tRNA(Ile2)-agmatinylcytidine synthase
MFIGIDDTDSPDGMCTTYLGLVLKERLESIENPILYRLNPNVRFKTRGNASISMRAQNENNKKIKKIVKDTIKEFAMVECNNTNPGVVFIDEDFNSITEEILSFPLKCVRSFVDISDAENILEKYSIDSFYLGNGRGRIGALASAIVCLVDTIYPELRYRVLPDHTYELLAYRKKERWGEKRVVDVESVFKADELTYPSTWDTVDTVNKELVCVPNTKCPVLLGVRGESEKAVISAFNMMKHEPIEGWVVYKTNQGTDLHIQNPSSNIDLKEGESYVVRGRVVSEPSTIRGGHVFFTIENEKEVKCAAFEPTKQFRNIVRELRVGDEVRVYGSYIENVLNLEKIEIVSLVNHELRNPLCPKCGKSMKSKGNGKGYECVKCGTYANSKRVVPIERPISVGLYEVPPCARRHISKPLVRMRGKCVHPMR